jgi:hypothetical protein
MRLFKKPTKVETDEIPVKLDPAVLAPPTANPACRLGPTKAHPERAESATFFLGVAMDRLVP